MICADNRHHNKIQESCMSVCIYFLRQNPKYMQWPISENKKHKKRYNNRQKTDRSEPVL